MKFISLQIYACEIGKCLWLKMPLFHIDKQVKAGS
ncbi:MAG: hypothetical protein ACI8PP_002020 [Candidatus Pseudothioglobus sp.]|jgi:hypothetical protein